MPAPSDRPDTPLPLGQGQLQVAAAKFALVHHLTGVAPEQRGRHGDAEGLQPLELVPEAAIDLLKRQQGFWFDDGAFAPLFQPGRRQPIEAFMQLGHPFGQNGEAASRRVAAVANQQIVAVLERLVGGKANRRPHRGPQAPIPFGGQQGHRPAEALH